MCKNITIALILLFLNFQILAAVGDIPQSFVLEGQLYDQPTGTDPFLGAATIEVRILSPNKLCVLYAEQQSINTTATEGVFNIQVGSVVNAGKRVTGVDAGNIMATVFQNTGAIAATGDSCPGVGLYTPATGGEERYVQIRVTPTATGITDVLSPEIYLGSVPTSIVSETLQGYVPSSFARVGTITNLTQSNLENIFSNTNYPILDSLLSSGGAGTSSTTDSILNADSDGNGTGSILFKVDGSIKAEVKNNGDFAVGTDLLYIDSSTSNIGIGVLSPSAVLDITSTTSGILIPRMTTAQRDAIASPAAMQIYNTSTNKLNFHNGTSWQELGVTGVTSITAGTGLTGGTITSTGTLAVDVGTAAGKIVQLDGSARIPAVDGSLLTNLTSANLGSVVSISKGGTGLSAVGAANTLLGTNSAGTAMEYKAASASTPLSITHGANTIAFDLGTVPTTKGGTGLSSVLTGNRVYTSNTLGTAFQAFTCSLTEVLSFNALGEPICSSLSSLSVIVSGGNTLGSDISIGTNDAFALNLKTNNSTKMSILSSGNVGIGITVPTATLDVRSPSGAASLNLLDGSNTRGLQVSSSTSGTNITNTGSFTGPSTNPMIKMYPGGAQALQITILRVQGTASDRGNRIQEWANIGGTTVSGMTDSGNLLLGSGATSITGTQLQVSPSSATTIGAGITAASEQTANLINVNSNGATNGDLFNISSAGKVGIGNSSPTAALHLPAGTTTASSAPLKFNTGTILTTPEAGAMEFDGTNLYITNSSASRRTLQYAGFSVMAPVIGSASSSVPLQVNMYGGSTTPASVNFIGNTQYAHTSSESGSMRIAQSFIPTSGTGIYNVLNLEPTINQTGGANGVTRGLYVNPILTAAADFRAAEFTNNVGYGVYQSGAAANNYFAGKVGIGITTPLAPLHIETATGPQIRLRNSSGTASEFAGIQIVNAANAQSNLFFRQSNYSSVNNAKAAQAVFNSNGWGGILINPTNPSGTVDFVTNEHASAFASILAMRIASTGNVGIGNASPSHKLDVADTTLAGSGSLAGSVLNLAQTWNTTGTPTAIKLNVTDTASDPSSLLMDLQKGGTSQFKINSAGVISGYQMSLTSTFSSGLAYATRFLNQSTNWGGGAFTGSPTISNTTSQYGLYLSPIFNQSSGSASNAMVRIEPTYNQTGTQSNTDFLINRTETALGSGPQRLIDAQVGGVSRFVINNTGKVGIGTTTPSEQLHVIGNILVSGTITPSDRRLKKNISPVVDSLKKITSLNGITYDWKDPKKHGDKRQLGVIAQDVQKVFPEAVTQTNDGFLAVSYSVLVSPLIEAVKELYSQVTNHSSRIEALELKAKSNVRAPASVNEPNEIQKLKAENQMLKSYLCQKDPSAPFCKR